jgi:putative peptidoglycan lipid II flippase
MLPVTIGLGIINIDVFINSTLGSLVSDQAPRAIDAAFRIYMLPQGMFSVAVATVLFPTLSRFAARGDHDGLRAAMATGVRQIGLLLIPSAAFMLVLATPIVRLVYQHGSFGPESTELVASALYWFSFSLPFAGINLLLIRTFFSLQKTWLPTLVSVGGLIVNLGVSLALYKPYGIPGLVVGTAASNAATMALLMYCLRPLLNGSVDGRSTLIHFIAMSIASALLGLVAYIVWSAVDSVLGRSLIAQILSVGLAAAAGAGAYGAAVLWMRLEEATQIRSLLAARLRR